MFGQHNNTRSVYIPGIERIQNCLALLILSFAAQVQVQWGEYFMKLWCLHRRALVRVDRQIRAFIDHIKGFIQRFCDARSCSKARAVHRTENVN